MIDKDRYYILMNTGSSWELLGKFGNYTEYFNEAISFYNKLDAILYVEKHGYEKISTIRKIKN